MQMLQRNIIFHYLKKLKQDVICLQETQKKGSKIFDFQIIGRRIYFI